VRLPLRLFHWETPKRLNIKKTLLTPGCSSEGSSAPVRRRVNPYSVTGMTRTENTTGGGTSSIPLVGIVIQTYVMTLQCLRLYNLCTFQHGCSTSRSKKRENAANCNPHVGLKLPGGGYPTHEPEVWGADLVSL